jgi:hypothetical protein
MKVEYSKSGGARRNNIRKGSNTKRPRNPRRNEQRNERRNGPPRRNSMEGNRRAGKTARIVKLGKRLGTRRVLLRGQNKRN